MLSIIETLDTFDTEYSADSVEWKKDEDIFVTGTYQLEERDDDVESSSKSTRKGRIYLFQFDNENLKLEKLQQIETEAILDQKWYMDKFLITATSLGKIQVYDYKEKQLNFNYEMKLNNDKDNEENLALSIDTDEQMKRVATSDSQGQISIIDLDTKNIASEWKAHEFEAWSCAFDKFNSNIIYSGKFKLSI